MALSRRSHRFQGSIWPGFVDAMTGLLLVLMFVLTIFMVIQFVLRETITGQESRLEQLSSEIAALSSALGLEQSRNVDLNDQLSALGNERDAQANLIAALRAERTEIANQLASAENQVTAFEAQVAGLLEEQTELNSRVSELSAEQDVLLSDQEALNLALAQARDEIDATVEQARLAAARREALEAMIADLRSENTEATQALTAAEEQLLVDQVAAEALRAKLEAGQAELTAMTLALEERRREAENTLTLLAAAQTARDDLDVRLAAALAAQLSSQAELNDLQNTGVDLDIRLAAALGLQSSTAQQLADAQAALTAASAREDSLSAQLAAALAAQVASEDDLTAAQAAIDAALADAQTSQTDLEARLAEALLAQQTAEAAQTTIEAESATLEDRLSEALLAKAALEAQVESLAEGQSVETQTRAEVESNLAEALAALAMAKTQAQDELTEAERQAALLATAQQALSEEEALSAEGQRQVAALNEQVAALRTQVATLQSLLNLADEADVQAQVQIQTLGAQLNTALARAAALERARAEDLESYRSEFFGELRRVLENQEGIRIEGDRFVFSSEVLFPPGGADLSNLGKTEISKVARLLKAVADDIPDNIDWIIRVDGHTDNIPLSGLGEYRNNWELSQARALAVVEFLVNSEGIPPSRLAANGFGEFQPLNPANTEEARDQNRRIELKLTER